MSFLKQKLFLQGYQTFINWFYLYLSYIFQKRRQISYSNFRYFKQNDFNRDFQNRLSAESVEKYAPFEKVFLVILNKHPSLCN